MTQPPQPDRARETGEPTEIPGAPPVAGAQPPQQPYYQQQPYAYGAPPSNGRAQWIVLGVLATVTVLALAVTGFVAPGFLLSTTESPAVTSSAPATSAPPATPSTESGPPLIIPAVRVPLPKRPAPLTDPASCAFPGDAKGSGTKKASPPQAGPVPATGTVAVTMTTTAGEIGLTLDRGLAPCTVASFLSLVQQGYYRGTSCHRLGTEAPLQMLQCGDPTGDGTGGPGYTVPDEIFPEIKYGRGIIAMAKAQEPHSGGSQFFMIYGDAELPPVYTVFGSISDQGLATLDRVARAGLDSSTGPGDGTGKPNRPVTFQSITVG